jgi:NitT/TauT family transport system substrate-binding protein
MKRTSLTRRAVFAGAFLLTAAVVGACSSSGASTGASASPSPTSTTPEKTSIKVTYGTASASIAPLWLAQEEGLFTKYGLTASLSLAASTVGATAVLSGDADVFAGEATSAFQAVAGGSPLELVGLQDKHSAFKLYGGPGITSPADLEGKAIAISAVGDSTDLATRVALAQFKIPASSVTLLATGSSPSRFAALA